jgi:hypothetical protein
LATPAKELQSKGRAKEKDIENREPNGSSENKNPRFRKIHPFSSQFWEGLFFNPTLVRP